MGTELTILYIMVKMVAMKPFQPQGRTPTPDQFTATEAKHEFGRLLEKAIGGHTIIITKHDDPKAVLMSMERFNMLTHAPELNLAALSREFDALLERMQGRNSRRAMQTAFTASPKQLGRAAIAAARKRG